MPKPKWLEDIESGRNAEPIKAPMCSSCAYYGRTVKYSRHKGKQWVDVHECDIHPGCENTEYSISCDDFAASRLV